MNEKQMCEWIDAIVYLYMFKGLELSLSEQDAILAKILKG